MNYGSSANKLIFGTGTLLSVKPSTWVVGFVRWILCPWQAGGYSQPLGKRKAEGWLCSELPSLICPWYGKLSKFPIFLDGTPQSGKGKHANFKINPKEKRLLWGNCSHPNAVVFLLLWTQFPGRLPALVIPLPVWRQLLLTYSPGTSTFFYRPCFIFLPKETPEPLEKSAEKSGKTNPLG